jgi:hypothetical protein
MFADATTFEGSPASAAICASTFRGASRCSSAARDAGFSIWEVKDMDEALAWAKRAPNPMPGKKSEMEIRPFYEAADLAEFVTPEELATPHKEERGKLGVA